MKIKTTGLIVYLLLLVSTSHLKAQDVDEVHRSLVYNEKNIKTYINSIMTEIKDQNFLMKSKNSERTYSFDPTKSKVTNFNLIYRILNLLIIDNNIPYSLSSYANKKFHCSRNGASILFQGKSLKGKRRKNNVCVAACVRIDRDEIEFNENENGSFMLITQVRCPKRKTGQVLKFSSKIK
ncbi:hypothetical protein N9N67_02920 [Bacteriovoracaceae bacterium]|nr:hypothetical protein [Bacteriovoracaceae bacterium]